MLSGTSERNQRQTFLHVSFSDSFGLASVRPPHRVCRMRLFFIDDANLQTILWPDNFQTKNIHFKCVICQTKRTIIQCIDKISYNIHNKKLIRSFIFINRITLQYDN